LFNDCRAVQAQSFGDPQAGSHAQDQVGPFAARAEGGKVVTRKQAEQAARAFVGPERLKAKGK
jgi:hypothetical protein